MLYKLEFSKRWKYISVDFDTDIFTLILYQIYGKEGSIVKFTPLKNVKDISRGGPNNKHNKN